MNLHTQQKTNFLMPYFQLHVSKFSLKGTTGRSRTKENSKVLSWYLRSGLPFQPSLTLPLRISSRKRSTSLQVLIYQVEIFRYYFRSCWSWYTTELFQLYLMHTEKQFWVYTGNEVLGPRKIEKLGLPSDLDRVDGSVQRGKGKVLLFNGENFWRYVNSASEL